MTEYKDIYQGKMLPSTLGSSGVRYSELCYEDPLIWVPRRNLFGTQLKEEYRGSRIKKLAGIIKREGVGFLMANPVVTCVLPEASALRVAILDGHHRTRAAGSVGIPEVPCKVFTPDSLSEALYAHMGLYYPPEKLEFDISNDTISANHSFEYCQLDVNKKPQLLPIACAVHIKSAA